MAQADRRAKESPWKTKYRGSLLKTTTMESEKQKDLRVFFFLIKQITMDCHQSICRYESYCNVKVHIKVLYDVKYNV